MRKLLAILLLVSNVVWAQNVDNTGNVLTTTNVINPNGWVGAIPMTSTQLSAVEGTGGGPLPAYNTDTNTIRFSFFPYTVGQTQAINSALFNNNSNVQLSGYNYSWKLYGDNGFLNVSGKLYGTNDTLLYSKSYSYQFSPANKMFWDQISGTESFPTSINSNTVGAMAFEVTGSDSLFWSGYYGPRIRDINVSFNYSIPASKPSTPTTTTTTTSAGVPTATEIASTASLPPPDTNPPPPGTEQNNNSAPPPPPGSPPPPPGSEPPPNNQQQAAVASNTQPQPTPTGSQQPAPAGQPAGQPNNNPQQGPATNNVASSSSTPQQNSPTATGPSLSSILTTIKNNEKKEQAIAASAVQGANDAAQAAVQATEQTALSVASASSNSSKQTATQQVSTVQQNNVQSSTFSQGIGLVSNTQQNYVAVNSQLAIGNNNTSVQQNVSNNQSTQSVNSQANSISIQPVVTQQSVTNTQVTMTGLRSAEVENTLFANNFLTNRSNPLTEIIENNVKSSGSTTEQKENTLNKNAQNNELAMGISLDKLMTQPIGYNSYLQLALRDTSFYAPKDIYKNQVPVDNKRSMYFLEKGNTDTYNRMIEGQYK
jgi:hypothetical protein